MQNKDDCRNERTQKIYLLITVLRKLLQSELQPNSHENQEKGKVEIGDIETSSLVLNTKKSHVVIHKSKMVLTSNRKHRTEGDRVETDSIQR